MGCPKQDEILDDKTEILHCHSRFINSTPPSSVTIADSAVEMSAEARNLGVLFDDNLSMNNKVSNICRAGWACIRRIGKIRKYLDEPSTEKLAQAFITSRIDSCNSLLLDFPEKEMQCLQ